MSAEPLECAERFPRELSKYLHTQWRANVKARGPWQTQDEGERNADVWLASILSDTHVGRWPENENWESWAVDRVGVCRTITTFQKESAVAIEALHGYARRYGVELHGESDRSVRARALDPDWWERVGRHAYVREVEALARKLGQVGTGAGLYVSDGTLRLWRERKARSERIVDGLVAVNEEGTAISLTDARNGSVSNPKVRRAELMTRLKGCEGVATQRGLSGSFMTLTAPSKMHRASEKWDGSDPTAVQLYFCGLWACLRSALKRRRIDVFGLRITEPHKDGTPHWHLLLWCHPDKQGELESLFREYALREDGNELGADRRRFTCERIRSGINPSTGKPYSAVGYIAKYIAKNVDGHAVGEHKALNEVGELESTDVPVSDAAERVLAWARVWGFRQFQFVGTPKVTVWRELRRLKAPTEVASIEPARVAADEGDWHAFMEADEQNRIELKKEQTGEANRYGELKADAVIGVCVGVESVRTRHHTWRILPSWTCDNNCTRVLGPFLIGTREGPKAVVLRVGTSRTESCRAQRDEEWNAANPREARNIQPSGAKNAVRDRSVSLQSPVARERPTIH